MRERPSRSGVSTAAWLAGLLALACSRAPGPSEAGGPHAAPSAGSRTHHRAGELEATAGSTGHASGSVAGVGGIDVVATEAVVDLLVAERSGSSVRLVHQRSRDGGRSWSGPTEVPAGELPVAAVHRGADPQIAAFGDRLLVAWTARGTSAWGTGPIGTAVSTDGGRTWAPGGSPADDGSTDGHGFLDLAAGADGTFHAVWLDGREGKGQGLRSALSRDGGRTWSANVTVDAGTCECCWNELRVDERGLLLLYRDRDPRDLRLVVSDDEGTTWRDAGRAGAFDWFVEACPHVGGALATVGGDFVALAWTGNGDRAGLYSTSRSRTAGPWSEPRRLGGRGARHGDLVEQRSRLVAVWDEPGDGTAHLFWSRSVDRGATWSLAAPIATDRPASHPLAVAVAAGVLVVWTESDDAGRTSLKSTVLDG